MAEYDFRSIEKRWQKYWEDHKVFKAEADKSKPKYYVLDMFPYPSGAGLHVGHPLGYIASDVVARYKRIKGFNVLHPMGFDSFGLPAEQYAVETGQHPALTTEKNIIRYKEQLRNIGFSYDWDKEVRTSDPNYYKWTQWIFIQLFKSWYNKESNQAEPIESLLTTFNESGNAAVNAVCNEETPPFTAEEWKKMNEKDRQKMLLNYRLTYLAETMVNWCPALGTVLANDEVKDGFSERGGFPVERKKMKQWMMRITAYAERLLQGLDTLDWPEPMKEMQSNWIGKSLGAELEFEVVGKPITLKVFTTRVDTTFGVTYVSIAPEHELIPELTAPEYKKQVEAYVEKAKNRSERDRMSDVKTVSGQFTGSYVINPFNGEKVPIWIADYVLAGYGTGVVMAVPSSDTRDYSFATHFSLPVIPVQEGEGTDITKENFDPKKGTMINSGFLNGLEVKDAIKKAIEFIEEKGIGKGKINYKMRDAVFGRQRYWGEPIPVYYKDDIPYPFDEKDLPLVLPEIDEYKPTETGEPPLGRAKDFKKDGHPIELSTMPGWAGSSWYYLRYMDPHNSKEFVSKSKEEYWNQVDLYIGGSEHATGHLLYSRFWNKFLKDRGYVSSEEPFRKLINQGMIQGTSEFVYLKGFESNVGDVVTKSNMEFLPSTFTNKVLTFADTKNIFYSYEFFKNFDDEDIKKYATRRPVDISIINKNVLDLKQYVKWRPEYKEAVFICTGGFWLHGQFHRQDENGSDKFYTKSEVEKMSKSKYNVVNPDEIVEKYGADTLRMYEMFLGPLEQFKPWNTNGIDGVFKFLKKLWKLAHDEAGNFKVSDQDPSKEELKILHKTIKKVEEDIERHSFNTSVSTFMICVNELTALKSNNRKILEELVIVLSPYAPHFAEELWSLLGHKESISLAKYPQWKQEYIAEESFEYPISVNGKMRAKIELPLSLSKEEIEKRVLESDVVLKWLEGKTPKKVIVVPNKIVNLVL